MVDGWFFLPKLGNLCAMLLYFFYVKKGNKTFNYFFVKIINKPINICKQNEIEYTYRKWKQAIDRPKFLIKVLKLFLDINKQDHLIDGLAPHGEYLENIQ